MLSTNSSTTSFPSLTRNASLSQTEQLLNYIKSGHSISLDGHSRETTPMIPVRSSKLLTSRGPAYPCHSLDLSTGLSDENLFRRSAHRQLYTADPSCFHRKRNDESPSTLAIQEKQLKDLLGTMHPTKDVDDIDKSKKWTFSIRKELDLKEHDNLEDYHFRNMTPIEDFVRPGDTSAPRQTGYEHGHIRSLFHLDTYGPTSSKQTLGSRKAKRLPKGNIDRYARLSPEHHLTLSPNNSIVGDDLPYLDSSGRSIGSNSSSRNSSRGSSHQSLGSTHRSSHEHSPRRHRHSLTTEHHLDLTIPSSLRDVKENFGKTRITLEDRLSYDPFVRRKQYDKTYKHTQKDKKEQRKFYESIDKYERQKKEIADIEKKRIRKFEKNLALAKHDATRNEGVIEFEKKPKQEGISCVRELIKIIRLSAQYRMPGLGPIYVCVYQ